MRFVYPEFLWALTLLIVPILIHLFSFKRYKTIYFSSLQFVKQVEQQNKSTQKLKNLLLLACRLLLLTCIIIAFAQPYFPKGQKTSSGEAPVVCLHIDNSFSMTIKGVEGELISEAIEAAKKVIEKAPLNTKILLSTNALDGIESRLCTKNQAIERLDKITPSPMVRSYDEVIKWQKDQLIHAIQKEKFSNTQFIFLSDFQKETHSFENLVADSSASYLPIQFVGQQNNNLSIDSIWFDAPLHKIGNSNTIHFKATNHGEKPLNNVQVQFITDDLKRDLFIDLPKFGSSEGELTFTPKKNGIHTGSISIQDKQFHSDDIYFFTYQVSEHSSILLLNGDDAIATMENIYKLDKFYTVQTIAQGSFTKDALNEKDLVVLNGINQVPSGLSANLVDFANSGGTVAIFPGKNCDIASMNAFLAQLKMPQLVKLVQQQSRIQKINYKDPFFKGVFDQEKDNLSLPGVSSYYLTNETTAGALGIIQMQNGKPLLYRRTKDQQVYLFASYLSPTNGSITSDILYTTILLRIGELALLSPPTAITIGVTSNYPVYKKVESNLPISLRNDHIDFIPPKRISGNSSYLDLSGTTAQGALNAGIYDVISNGTVVTKMAANYNRKESKIGNYTNDEIEKALKSVGILNTKLFSIKEGVSGVHLNIDKPYPYWKIFVSFALIFLVAEMLIMKLWKNKTGN